MRYGVLNKRTDLIKSAKAFYIVQSRQRVGVRLILKMETTKIVYKGPEAIVLSGKGREKKNDNEEVGLEAANF